MTTTSTDFAHSLDVRQRLTQLQTWYDVKIGLKVPRMIRLKIPRTNNRNVGQLLLLGW